MNTDAIRVDEERCARCGRCVVTCPQRVLANAENGGPPGVDDEAAASCIRCGQCVAVCPAGAIALGGLGEGDFPASTPPPEPEAVLAWLRGRRSVRVYREDPLPRKALTRLLEAARYAPTGHNARQVGCVALLSESSRRALREGLLAFYRRIFRLAEGRGGRTLLRLWVGARGLREIQEALLSARRAEARILRGEDPLFHAAPAILIFHAPASETAEVDCALAASQATLLAPSLDLGTCYIGYASAALRRRPALARNAGVPEGDIPYIVLTLGHPAVCYPRWVPRPEIPLRVR